MSGVIGHAMVGARLNLTIEIMPLLPDGVAGNAFPILASLVLCMTTFWGVGGLIPAGAAGLRLARGASLVPLWMVGANFGLGLPLTAAAALLVAAALAGMVIGRRAGFLPPWFHPAWLLPALVAALVLWRGGLSYQPYSWDEFSAWLYWPREAFMLDDARAATDWRPMGYTQGLVLASVFPNLFFGNFDEVRQLAFPLALHIAMLATAFDFTAATSCERLGFSASRARVVAWLAVLVLLAVEASWTLVPQLLQAEKPQIHLAVIVVLLLAEGAVQPERLRSNAVVVGLSLAAGFLVKSSFLAVIAPAALALLWLCLATPRREWAAAAAVLIPMAVILAWGAIKGPVGQGCMGNPMGAFTKQASGGLPTDMALRLAAGIWDYLLAYKPWLTGLGLLGLALGLAGRLRVAVLVLIGLTLIYVLSLHIVYTTCLNSGEGQALASLPRYLRVPLRVVHTVGLLFLLLEGARWLRARWPGFDRLASGRIGLVAALGALAVLGAWQVSAVARALDNVATRVHERDGGEFQFRVGREAEAVAQLARTYGPRVVIVAQGSSGEEFTYGRYYAIGRNRTDPFHRFETAETYSFAPSAATPWTTVGSAAEVAARLDRADVIWLFRVDAWMADILAPRLDDGECLRRPRGKALVHGADGRLLCRSLGDAMR